jgi:CDP-6-deoxy-D-xylo-4-hexulose-3-dehydrase
MNLKTNESQKPKYPLASNNFSEEEIEAATSVMRSGRYTMGEKTRAFETAFADWVGAKHAVMVNSGSSANLLLTEAILRPLHGSPRLKSGDEVLVPALSWPTTVWPLVQLGLVPVFVDIDPITLAIDVEAAKRALSPRVKGMFLIHVLGQAANMKVLTAFCKDHDLVLMEDCCESLGSYHQNVHVGLFGSGGTFSHFFSHHLTTMEGGSIVTNDDQLADDLRGMRAHGWSRDRSDKKHWEEKNPHLDPRFLFVQTGYNVRPTDIQAAVGLVQLKRLDGFLDSRRQYASEAHALTQKHAPWIRLIGNEKLAHVSSRKERTHSWMTLPFVLDKKSPVNVEKVKEILESHGVETRPIIAGNLVKHPVMSRITSRVAGEMTNSNDILDRGFMIGCHSQPSRDVSEALAFGFSQLSRL